jgi:ribosome-associated protein
LDTGVLGEFVAYRWTSGKLDAQMKSCGLETGAVIAITDEIYINEDEIVVKVSRSSGPGGQNVNKVNTRVTLFFDVAACETLSQTQKQRILARLATRSDKNGVLRVASQKFRTQSANRTAAMERLCRLLGEALAPPPIRKRTRAPARAHEKRLEQKKRRSALKRLRSGRDFGF